VGSPLKRHRVAFAALSVVAASVVVALLPTTAHAATAGDGAGRQVLCDRADYGCVDGTG
jgi:hypothetical protein